MSRPRASAGVIIAAVVAAIGSVLTMFCLALGAMGLYLTPAGKSSPGVPPIPPSALAAAGIMLVVMFALAIFGFCTGIGLFLLKNWARISALIWAGFTVFFCFLALLFILVLPFPAVPTASGVSMTAVKGMLALFYGVPIMIGVWWLILFNQKSTKAQFTGTSVVAAPELPAKLRCPLPVAIIAGFMLISVAGMFLMPLLHMPITVIFFGNRLRGESGAFLFASSAVLYLAAALGLLTLKRWSYSLAIGLQAFYMVSGAVTFLRRNFAQNLQEVVSEMHIEQPSGDILLLMTNRLFTLVTLLPGLLILGILLYCRSSFLRAVAAVEPVKTD